MLISRESFESADEHTRQLLIFDLLTEQREILKDHIVAQKDVCKIHCDGCDERFKRIEKRKYVDAGLAAGGGMVGGFIAVIAKAVFWK